MKQKLIIGKNVFSLIIICFYYYKLLFNFWCVQLDRYAYMCERMLSTFLFLHL